MFVHRPRSAKLAKYLQTLDSFAVRSFAQAAGRVALFEGRMCSRDLCHVAQRVVDVSAMRVTVSRASALLAVCLFALFSVGCDSESDSASTGEEQGGWRSLPQARIAERGGLGGFAPFRVGGDVVLITAGGFDADHVEALAFDLRPKRWRRLPDGPITWRSDYSAVKAARRVIVWGGAPGPLGPQGAIYRHGARIWRVIPDSPLQDRSGHSAVWTGEEMIVWGGESGYECGGRTSRGGAAYSPKMRRWRRITPAPINGRLGHIAIWTGEEMIVWGGIAQRDGACDPKGVLADGASYDPELDQWESIPEAPIQSGEEPEAFWTGEEMLVWSGAKVAIYRPRTNEWRQAADSPLRRRIDEAIEWNRRELLIWGGDRHQRGQVFTDGAAYSPSSDAWRRLPEAPLERPLAAIWTDDAFFVFAPGCCKPRYELPDGAKYVP